MTVLGWRPHTRATLLRRMRDAFAGIGMAISTSEELDPYTPDDAAQHLEDARIAIPLDRLPGMSPTHPFRRRLNSTVWHSSEACPWWPAEVPFEQRVGRPLVGMGCGRCAASGGDSDG